MLDYNQTLPDKKLFQDLQMTEVKSIMKLIIRGKKRNFISAVGKSLNIFFNYGKHTRDFTFIDDIV